MPSSRLLFGRRSLPNACYALTSTVAGRRKAFVDPKSVECVIEALRCSDREHRSRTLAYVVMPDHVHWLMQLREGTLSRCMQAFKGRSSRAYNLLHNSQGNALWQRGYYDHCVRTDECLERHARYLIENPLRAGLVNALEDYPWQWSRWTAAANKNGTPKGAVEN